MIDTSLSNAVLLEALADERNHYTLADEGKMRRIIDVLVARGVYPPIPENVQADHFTMVFSWGAYWHLWTEPHACPLCKADLRDHRLGPPFKREYGRYDVQRDRTMEYVCPDCMGVIERRP